MPTVPNWREHPAELLEEIFTLANNTSDPPTLEEMTRFIRRRGIKVAFVEPTESREAVGSYEHMGVLIPRGDRERMLLQLVHEVSELLLRLPVQPEYHHPITGQDEYHQVAALTAERLKQALKAERERLTEEEISLEAEIDRLCAERQRQGQAFAAYGSAIQTEQDTSGLTLPTRKEVRAIEAALAAAQSRLGKVQARLRG